MQSHKSYLQYNPINDPILLTVAKSLPQKALTEMEYKNYCLYNTVLVVVTFICAVFQGDLYTIDCNMYTVNQLQVHISYEFKIVKHLSQYLI
jgi:hypothetical protein